MRDYKEIFKKYLQSVGKAYAREIEIVLEKVFTIHGHFTNEDLEKKLVEKQITKDIVEATLSDLVAAGLIRKIYFEDRVYYEQVYGHAHHDHIICINCGKIDAFQDDLIEKEQQRIAKEKHYEFLKHSMQIVGLCLECQKQKNILKRFQEQKEDKGIEKEKILPLSMILPGEQVEIVELNAGDNLKYRLMSMGLQTGQKIEVVSNSFHGPFLVKVQNARIALGYGVTHKVLVRRLENDEKK